MPASASSSDFIHHSAHMVQFGRKCSSSGSVLIFQQFRLFSKTHRRRTACFRFESFHLNSVRWLEAVWTKWDTNHKPSCGVSAQRVHLQMMSPSSNCSPSTHIYFIVLRAKHFFCFTLHVISGELSAQYKTENEALTQPQAWPEDSQLRPCTV